MKKFRVLLALSALLLAFGAAFASQSSQVYYEWRVLTLECVARSVPSIDCSTQPSLLLCNIIDIDDGGLVLLRNNDIVQNQCGPSLFRRN